MHPLKFFSQTFNIPLAKVAEHLEIKRQSINEWVGKRQKPIPKKHLPKLAKLFGVDEKWFEKIELKPSEQIEIQRIKLARDVTYIEIPTQHVDEEGNVFEGIDYYSPQEEEDTIKRYEQRIAKVSEDVEFILKDFPERGDEDLKVFEAVISIINDKDYVNKKMLRDTTVFLTEKVIFGSTFGIDTDKEELLIKLYDKYKKGK